MFDETVLRDHISTVTGYSTALTSGLMVDTMLSSPVTKVYVGHKGIKVKHPEFLYANGYDEVENPCILITIVQIVCARSEFTTVRTAVQQAYKDFSPIDNADFSRLFFIEGNVLATTDSKILYEEFVGLMFPQIT